jgi:hypothetical protein
MNQGLMKIESFDFHLFDKKKVYLLGTLQVCRDNWRGSEPKKKKSDLLQSKSCEQTRERQLQVKVLQRGLSKLAFVLHKDGKL